MNDHEQDQPSRRIDNGATVHAGEAAAEATTDWVRRNVIGRGLAAFAEDVERNWLASDYLGDMQRNREQFRHAHIHAMKALGQIAALIDHVDHDRLQVNEAVYLLQDLPKLLADLTRCSAKMAQTAPRQIDFAQANIDRAEQLAARWTVIRSRR